MERILCLIGGEWNADLEAKISPYDDDEHEIHLFDHICDGEMELSDVLGTLENLIMEDKEDIPCTFMTDIPNLFSLVQGVYQRTFCGFILLEHPAGTDCQMIENGLYQALIQMLENNVELTGEGSLTRAYVYQGISHVFEPVYGEMHHISLDGSSADGRWIYHYPFLQPQINEMKAWVDADDYMNHMGDIQKIFEQVKEQKREIGLFQYDMFLIALRNLLLQYDKAQCFFILHALSFLIAMTNDSATLNWFMEFVLSLKGILSGQHFYFLSNQIKRWNLENPTLRGNGDLLSAIYQEAYLYYKNELSGLTTPIPKEERNQDLIVVMTIQFLEEGHAPTRTALERIYTLGKLMNKKVLVINTREQYSSKGELPLYTIIKGKAIKEYDNRNQFSWRDYTFDFYQASCSMPDLNEMAGIIRKLRALKPHAIITVGNGSIVSDVCANMIPVLGIPVTFSTIPKKDNQLTVVGRYISEEEKKKLTEMGYDLDRIIESTFTFAMKEQTTTLTRKQLNLPENHFLLGVVGIRLDYEVDTEFLEVMEQTLSYNTHLVFAGKFEQYEKYCKEIPWLSEHSTFVGYQKDILAFMETIDLYVNPRRMGGGFSIIEAFVKGRPGVTISYGDVATAAGKEFCVADYDEMIETIKRYVEDKEFYQKQVEKGRLRAVKMTDSKAALKEILAEAESRKAFF